MKYILILLLISSAATAQDTATVRNLPIYNYCLSNSDGMGYGSQFKATIASARAANSYLNRLCLAYELQWTERLIQLRLNGRKLLTGKQ
jgi:hypothetical protein